MNNALNLKSFIPILLILLGLWFVANLLSGQGNLLGDTYTYALPAVFFIGCISPKKALYIMVIMAGYLDVLKKMMVAGGNMYFSDVFFVLGMPATILLGICINVFVGWLSGNYLFTRKDIVLFTISFVLVIFTAVISLFQSGLNIAALKDLANTSAYCGLIFTLPVLLKTPEDIRRFLRFSVLIMIPAAIHAYWHYFMGPFEFEDEYMLSGFSSSLVYWLEGEGIFGPFAAQGPLATVMTLCASLAMVAFLHDKGVDKHSRIFSKKIAMILIMFFLMAGVISLKRGPLLIFPLLIFGVIILRSRLLTIITYITAVTLLILITVYSVTLADNLVGWQTSINALVGDDLADTGIFRVRTFHTRFLDFAFLLESQNWQPFGVDWADGEGAYYIHSLPVKMLMKYGYIPVTTVIILIFPFMWFLHNNLLRRCKEKSLESNLLLVGASLVFSMVIGAGLGLVVLNSYPTPFFLGLFAAISLAGICTRSRSAGAKENIQV